MSTVKQCGNFWCCESARIGIILTDPVLPFQLNVKLNYSFFQKISIYRPKHWKLCHLWHRRETMKTGNAVNKSKKCSDFPTGVKLGAGSGSGSESKWKVASGLVWIMKRCRSTTHVNHCPYLGLDSVSLRLAVWKSWKCRRKEWKKPRQSGTELSAPCFVSEIESHSMFFFSQ